MSRGETAFRYEAILHMPKGASRAGCQSGAGKLRTQDVGPFPLGA
jgi:hypothetical protein